MPNCKSVALTLMELTAFNSQILLGNVTGYAPFYPLLTLRVGGHQETPFEL